MGDKKKLCQVIQIKAQKLLKSPLMIQPFRILTITLLSLLLPLSFLLLARLSCARFLLSLTNNNINTNNNNSDNNSSTRFFSVFVYTNPILYFLVSIISVSTLVHNLSTGKLVTSFLSDDQRYTPSPDSLRRRPVRLYASWIFLCALQVCVGLGIKGSAAFGTDFSGFGSSKKGSALFSKVIFFIGLHEMMLHWCRAVVRPVVDDTVSCAGGVSRCAEKWAQRGVVAGGFGSLWYWRLRDEVEALVAAAEARGEMLMEVGLGDFAGWWLYYLTVTVGMVRVVKGLMWVLMSLFRRRININGALELIVSDYDHNQQQQQQQPQTCLDVDDRGHNDDDQKISVSSNVDVC